MRSVGYVREYFVVLALVIGITIGIIFARCFWSYEFNHYVEARHSYKYCPYCGEEIER